CIARRRRWWRMRSARSRASRSTSTMSTSDPFDLPVEARGPVNQVSAGTNTSPLGTSPGPGMLAGASPGISPAAIAPIAAPPVPDPSDPAAMALLIARMANELFGAPAASAAPVPSPQQAMSGAGASAPASPGPSLGLLSDPAPAATMSPAIPDAELPIAP